LKLERYLERQNLCPAVSSLEACPTLAPKSTGCWYVTVFYNGKIYDPSYGIGPFNSTLDYENAALAGFSHLTNYPAAKRFFHA
jgi:hypothetical protein